MYIHNMCAYVCVCVCVCVCGSPTSDEVQNKKKMASTVRRLGFTYPEAYFTVCISVNGLGATHSRRLIGDTTVNWSQQLTGQYHFTADESGESLGVGNLVAPLSDLEKSERERGRGKVNARERQGTAR